MKKGKVYVRDGRAPIPKDEKTSKAMSAIKGKNTKPELLLRKVLWKDNVRGYRLHLAKLSGRPDIAFPKKKIAVFVNGCFWHRCPYCNPNTPKSNIDFWEQKFAKNIERDKNKARLLAAEGWKVLTIWECQINNDLNQQIIRIKLLLNE